MRDSALPRPRFQLLELESRLTPAGDLFVVPSPLPGESVQLRFERGGGESDFRSEFGFFVVDDAAGRVDGLLPSDQGYAGVALARAQVVFASGSGLGARSDVPLNGGQSLGFYLVANATTNEARVAGATVFFSVAGANADRMDHVRTQARGDGGTELRFEDQFGGGDGDFDDAVFSVIRSNALATPGQPGQTVPATLERLSRNGSRPVEVGVYRVDEAGGTVDGLSPGAAGYLQAALGRRQTVFAAGDAGTGPRTLTLEAGAFYGVYFVVGGSAERLLASPTGAGFVPYFSFIAANPDRIDHLSWRSADTFGFEDGLGGGDLDFDDSVFRLAFGLPQGTPTPPPPPAPTEPVTPPAPPADPTSPPPVPPPLADSTAPTVSYRLNTDSGTANNDAVTNDARGVLTVTDGGSTITSLRAGFAAATVDILSRRGANGTVTVDAALLTQLNGGVVLPNGPRTLFVEAIDSASNRRAFQFPFTLDSTAPTASYTFTTDSGASNSDRITNNAQGVLVVNDNLSSIATLQAGFGTANIDILSRRGANGSVTVDTALLTQLNQGVALLDGARTLLVTATDGAGNQNAFQFPFTLDRAAPAAATFDLAAASDSGTVGDLRTDAATVTLSGTAEAGSTVQLSVPPVPGTPGAGAVLASVTALANGTFTIPNVALAVGPNSFTVRAVDVAGNVGATFSQTFVRNAPPTVAAAIAPQAIQDGDPNRTFDLATVFADAERVVRFATAYPTGQTANIDFQLFDADAPATVANFLAYVNSANPQQDYNGVIFHRLAPGFVLQGGGFNFDPAGTDTATTFPAVPDFAAVVNEPGVSNTRGTLAMAKLGNDPNSATNEFFFNLADNSGNLDNQNGGFTVFGQVMNGGQQALDTLIGNLTTFSGGGLPGAPPFPIRNGADTSNFPLNVVANDLAVITTASELTVAQRMTFSVVSNTNAAAASATIVGSTLTVDPLAVGVTTITVRATDLDGSVTDTSFTVTVTASP